MNPIRGRARHLIGALLALLTVLALAESPASAALSQSQIQQLYTRTGVSADGAAIPRGMLPHYQNAAAWAKSAKGCAIPWTVLAAIGRTESNHNLNPPQINPSGARGPMQFMPSTWSSYGIDGNGDGVKDVFNPADATAGAANLLCAVGAGNPTTLRSALTQYAGSSTYPDVALDIAWSYGAPGNAVPVGSFDVAVDQFRAVKVSGWAGDPDAGTAPVAVHFYVDGSGPVVAPAAENVNNYPGVAAAYPALGGNHGFERLVPVANGTHSVCAYAIDTAGGTNPSLGCKSLYVGNEPGGGLDDVTAGLDHVNVRGWAADPNAGQNPIAVDVYVDNVRTSLDASKVANRRDDVGNAYPEVGPNHGYDQRVAAVAGTHNVCTYAINVGIGGNQTLGCKSVTITGDPIGSVDAVTVVDGGYRVNGWALDPQGANSGQTEVHVYVNNTRVAVSPANTRRDDVANAYPGYSHNLGYDLTVPGVAGPNNQVCVYAINVGTGTTNTTLGCRNFTGVNPDGALDLATQTAAHQLRGAGWGFDADLGTSPSLVFLILDPSAADPNINSGMGYLQATKTRTDVGNAYPSSGPNHGFDFTITTNANVTPGTGHQLCAYIQNAGAGTQKVICKPITIT